MFYSPLRYPGGKNRLSKFIAKICIDNQVTGHYIEPYAGGASVALFLLFEGIIKKITINDKDRSIYAFWYSVLNYTNELCKLIEDTAICVKNWKKQREIQKDKRKTNLLELGFSTLFLNRTNFSGIINGGVIGGLEQKGKYKMDCRFNKEDIISRIIKISERKRDIHLYEKDALKLVDKIEKEAILENTIFYFDPPYYSKGSSLYMHYYEEKDHELVSSKIKTIRDVNWIVSYDNVPEIGRLYYNFRKKEYSFNHTAHKSKKGNEILFFCDKLNIPEGDWSPLDFNKNYT